MKRCLPIFLLLLSVSAHGALNKWVDTEGKVHYSDQPPPPNAKIQTLTVPSAVSGASASKSLAESEEEQKTKGEAEPQQK